MGREEEETGWSDDIFVTWKGFARRKEGTESRGLS
jgi:hypothetical protein